MTLKRSICCLITSLGLFATLSGESDSKALGDTLTMPTEQTNAIIQQSPMPDLGKGRLARILTRYYNDGLGGAEQWDQISSLKLNGTLKLEEGVFELNAYQKKPDLIKMMIRDNRSHQVLVYDGTNAWKKITGSKTEPVPMTESEARRFKHSSLLGSHLLYPYARGKEIEYVDTVPTEGYICHQIRVTLDSGYQVDYFIDIRTYLQRKAVHLDLRSGLVNSIVYKNYVRELGMPIAKEVESFENGEWVSSLTLNDFKVNSGVMPWMFKMNH